MEMVTHEVKEKGPFRLVPLGDVQWAGRERGTALTLLRERIASALDQGAYFLGMGDYIDFASPSNRARLRSADLYDTAQQVIDDKAVELMEEIFELALKPTVGRWLGLLEGHHFTQLTSGMTTDQILAQKLRCPHLGSSAYVRVLLPGSGTTQGPLPVNIWASHGCGSGQTSAAPVQKLERLLPSFEADVFILGHMTKQAVAPVNRVYPVWGYGGMPRLAHKKIQLVGSGGFSKGYEVGSRRGATPRGSYVEQGLMRPTVLGAPMITMSIRRAQVPNADGSGRRVGRRAEKTHPNGNLALTETRVPDITVEV